MIEMPQQCYDVDATMVTRTTEDGAYLKRQQTAVHDVMHDVAVID
jgi:hypothetical protein